MKYLTIEEFADFKRTSRQTISLHLKQNKIIWERKYGRKLIPLNKKNLLWQPQQGLKLLDNNA